MGEKEKKKSATFAFCLPETEQMSKLFLKQKKSFFWFVFVLLEHGPSQIDLFYVIVAKQDIACSINCCLIYAFTMLKLLLRSAKLNRYLF
jgi:hypothetical protein